MWTLCKELKGTQSFSEQDYFPYREIMGKTAGFLDKSEAPSQQHCARTEGATHSTLHLKLADSAKRGLLPSGGIRRGQPDANLKPLGAEI
jgi:hypothetical protein